MRGIGCLLTGTELFPGNIQGGSDTPAGWSKGISIDQEMKNFLQAKPETRTRFGSLEFGVMVPDRADTWTRMSYAGPNKPLAPIDDPYQMFAKLYGRMKDEQALGSVLDDLQEDFKKVEKLVNAEDRQLLKEHTTFVREMEQELKADSTRGHGPRRPQARSGRQRRKRQHASSLKLQIELMVSSFTADFARVATFQITNSVGDARMHWLGINEGHHQLSHEPDSNEEAVEKLININKWYGEQLAYLAKRLAETPEPGGAGTLLDNTTIVWTNELGKGNSHTLDHIPFVMIGGGLGYKMGRCARIQKGPAQSTLTLSGPLLRPRAQDIRQPRLLRRRASYRSGVSSERDCVVQYLVERGEYGVLTTRYLARPVVSRCEYTGYVLHGGQGSHQTEAKPASIARAFGNRGRPCRTDSFDDRAQWLGFTLVSVWLRPVTAKTASCARGAVTRVICQSAYRQIAGVLGPAALIEMSKSGRFFWKETEARCVTAALLASRPLTGTVKAERWPRGSHLSTVGGQFREEILSQSGG